MTTPGTGKQKPVKSITELLNPYRILFMKEIVDKGQRVRILGHEDVWVKISWMDEIAYIRETQIREIEL